jgi:hypothetical protein
MKISLRYFLVFFATVLVMAAATSSAQEIKSSPKQEPWTYSYFMPSNPSPFLVSETDSRKWFDKIRSGLEPKRSVKSEKPVHLIVAVIQNADSEVYLLANWYFRRFAASAPIVDFYRMSPGLPSAVKLEYLHSISSVQFGHISFDVSTGHPFEPGTPPIVNIYVEDGGNSPQSSHIHFFSMAGNAREITPGWSGNIWPAEDLNGDGRPEFKINMQKDEELADGCEDCWSQYVPAILTWRNGSFLPACKKNYTAFTELKAWNLASIVGADLNKEGDLWSPRMGDDILRLEHVANMALIHAQTGNHKWASAFGKEFARGYNKPSHPILDVLKKAKSLDHLQCPVSAALSDDPRWRVQ